MLYKLGMSEEEYKLSVYEHFFKNYKYLPNWGKSKIDFVIADPKDHTRHLLWAEAKSAKTPWMQMLTQLVLTVKKTYFSGEVVPPAYLAVFDTEGFWLFRTSEFTEYFFRKDIEWKTTPSNYNDPRFKELQTLINDYVRVMRSVQYSYAKDIADFKGFISTVFAQQVDEQGIEITLANLNHVFNKWCDEVKPTIALTSDKWKAYHKQGVYPVDFFLADAYVGNVKDATLVDSLKVGILGTTYHVKETQLKLTLEDELFKQVKFTDEGRAYRQFWSRYKRPPRNVHTVADEKTPWEQLLDRRDLLVPRDVMERRGSFFTPRMWVEKAHEYLADALGDNWQDEYVVFDACAGTGNLLAGLYNQRNIFASDLDEQNVRIMIEESKPTFRTNIFQFDFLNDSFIRQSHGGKVPDGLMDVLEDPEKRKKLVFLINPPYAEGGNQRKVKSTGLLSSSGKEGVSNGTKVWSDYRDTLGMAVRELFVQFLARIYGEFKGCTVAEFSTLKALQGPNFAKFRAWYTADLLSCFLVPGNTFDNVSGQFPIGFKMWDTGVKSSFTCIKADVFGADGSYLGVHAVNVGQEATINKWLKSQIRVGTEIAGMCTMGNDFQQTNLVQLASNTASIRTGTAGGMAKISVTAGYVLSAAVYFAARWSVEATWLNDRDQFLYPHTDPLQDQGFVNDSLIFAMFHGNNHISVEKGANHWIPFTERQLGVNVPFTHTTVYEHLKSRGIFLDASGEPQGLSKEAAEVYRLGYEIFKHYHTGNGGKPFAYSPDGKMTYNPNAALYDIRKFFQGTNEVGKMKTKSEDEVYRKLIEGLRGAVKELRDKRIAHKVYEYGFLLKSE